MCRAGASTILSVATTVLAGRYELGPKLGSGGMATVYEAHDELLDRAVAVKLLRSEALSEHTARQRFAAEARAAASLTHPHAVAVYDVSSGDEQPFIVMELVRGRTLEDVLDEGRLDVAQAVAVGSQILTALHAAHRRGIVHRDVKPANILLPDGVVPTRPEQLPGVKLADFGIAKAVTDATVGLTTVGQVIGTPKYLSPEQVKGERATPKSDLYATGVVLYEMLAGQPPFDRDSALSLALAHREDEPPPLRDLRPDLNPAVVALVHRALAKDPADRPADADEMREALIAAAVGAPHGTQVLHGGAASTQVVPPGGPIGPTEPVAPAATAPVAPPPRRGWWMVVLALVVLGVLAALWLRDVATNTDEPVDDRQEQTPSPEQPGAADQDQAPEQDGGTTQDQDADTTQDQDADATQDQDSGTSDEDAGPAPQDPEPDQDPDPDPGDGPGGQPDSGEDPDPNDGPDPTEPPAEEPSGG
jgi:eukaryotic-like serine/threonine-protein kinase